MTRLLCEHDRVTERYVSTHEAARALGISRSTLARWVTRYGLEPTSVTMGGHYRWDVDALRRQIKERRPTD